MNIFEYSDYRKIIIDKFNALKNSEGGFSYRLFSQLCGFTSPNYLKLVSQGKRNLSLEASRKVALALKLSSKEAEYFQLLVKASLTKQSDEKAEVTEKLIKFKKTALKKRQQVADYNYYKAWFNIPMRECFLVLGQKIKNHKKIAKVFLHKLSKEDVKESLDTLFQLNLLKKNSSGEILLGTEESLVANDIIIKTLVAEYHIKMLELAKNSLNNLPSSEREFGAVTVALSEDGFLKLKNLIREYREKVLEIAEADKNKKDVFQIGFQMFPITKGLSDED